MASLVHGPHVPTIGFQQGVTIGTRGAIGELLAAADLMRRGYHVYRALSPNAPCDLLAFKTAIPRMPLRVEVRLATVDPKYDTLRFRLKEEDARRFDLLALVVGEKDVYYIPELVEGPGCPYAVSPNHLNALRSWGVIPPNYKLRGHRNKPDNGRSEDTPA